MKACWFIWLCTLLLLSSLLQAQKADTLGMPEEEKVPLVQADGYIKELGMLGFNNSFGNGQYDNIIHGRLNTHWRFSPKLSGEADLRLRLFNGFTPRHAPAYGCFLGDDPGAVDLSWVPLDSRNAVLHAQIDRLYLNWETEKWNLRLGRQRVNWGNNYVWNPNDLFNAFAYLDFDYEERPGTDAIRFQYYSSFASGFEVAYRPDRYWDRSVLGFMYKGNFKQYDYQLIAAHYQEELALGGGWAGNIKAIGFKGELTYFHPEKAMLERSGYLLASAGLDYAFSNSLYLQFENLYNGNPNLRQAGFGLMNSQLSANNLFPSQYALFLNASYPLHPLLSVSLGGIQGFDQNLSILIPSISFSISDNLSLLLMGQLLRAKELEALGINQNYVYVRLKWSF